MRLPQMIPSQESITNRAVARTRADEWNHHDVLIIATGEVKARRAVDMLFSAAPSRQAIRRSSSLSWTNEWCLLRMKDMLVGGSLLPSKEPPAWSAESLFQREGVPAHAMLAFDASVDHRLRGPSPGQSRPGRGGEAANR